MAFLWQQTGNHEEVGLGIGENPTVKGKVNVCLEPSLTDAVLGTNVFDCRKVGVRELYCGRSIS